MPSYGSLQNHLAACTPQASALPEIGEGATVFYWSDRHAATVVDVKTYPRRGPKIMLQRDIAKRTDRYGMSDAQGYSYERNPDAPIIEVTYRQGHWRVVGSHDHVVRFGERSEYYDFSF